MTIEGISLRDHFAAKAMEALVNQVDPTFRVLEDSPWIAKVAYAIADAMMAEREKAE